MPDVLSPELLRKMHACLRFISAGLLVATIMFARIHHQKPGPWEEKQVKFPSFSANY